MNYVDFEQTGGFPLSTDILTFMQENQNMLQEIAEGFGELTNVGDAVVIHGCVDNGTTITPGLIYLKKTDGTKELIPFLQASALTDGKDYYTISGTTDQKEFYDGTCKDVMYTRWCELTSTPTDYSLANLIRPKTVAQLTTETASLTTTVTNNKTTSDNGSVPVGVIVMWSGPIGGIPSNWKLCDGQNERPDLRGRFIVGSKDGEPGALPPDDDRKENVSYNIGDHDGKQSVKLEASESGVGSHTHTYTARTSYTSTLASDFEGASDVGYYLNTKLTTSTESAAASASHENRPPYYALAYIIKVS